MDKDGTWALGRGQPGRARTACSGPTDLGPGLCQAIWWNGTGRPDTFVVAHAAHADARWLRLADIVIQPAQLTLLLAEDVVEASFAQWSGCALAAVHVETLGHVLRWRDGRQQVIRTSAGPAGLLWWCGAEYISRLSEDGSPAAAGVRSGTRAQIGAS
jgi:hypothetical protein